MNKLKGTLIATIITKNKIYLLSDGRVINKDTGAVYNAFSKVYKLNDKVGMLTAGDYIKDLDTDIINNCKINNIIFVDKVAEVSKLVLQNIWNSFITKTDTAIVKNVRIFIFIIGFDNVGKPCMFYLDNKSEPPFIIQERRLFIGGQEIEIAAISPGSSENVNPTELITNYLSTYHTNMKNFDINKAVYFSFDKVKNELSETDMKVGGETFFAQIEFNSGFLDLTEKYKKEINSNKSIIKKRRKK